MACLIKEVLVMQSFQLSHEELLLLLGLARLPMPLALGEQPITGYNPETLNAALGSAANSLLARGLLIPATPPSTTPLLEEGIAALLTNIALAENCLIVGGRQGELGRTVTYTIRDMEIVRHTQPFEGVHRLEHLAPGTMIADLLTQEIIPHTPMTQRNFVVQADVLGLVLEALAVGQLATATSVLLTAGIARPMVNEFVAGLGSQLTRYALLLFRNLRSSAPHITSQVVLQGQTETWYVEEVGDKQVQLWAITPDQLRIRFEQLGQEFATPIPA